MSQRILKQRTLNQKLKIHQNQTLFLNLDLFVKVLKIYILINTSTIDLSTNWFYLEKNKKETNSSHTKEGHATEEIKKVEKSDPATIPQKMEGNYPMFIVKLLYILVCF